MTDKAIILAGGISSRMKKYEDAIASLDSAILKDTEEKQKAMIGVGDNNRPFLDYLLTNLMKSGIKEIVIVIGENDNSIKNYYGANGKNANFEKLKIWYAVQKIPEGRSKPSGTADALFCGLQSVPEWKNRSFLVCNSDNLYSVKAITILIESSFLNAMIDYDSEGLIFEPERIQRFAITSKNSGSYLTDIIEKPSEQLINEFKRKDGYIGISMNIFKLSYDNIFPMLPDVPYNSERNEKELPYAVKMMIDKNPYAMYTYRLHEHVPDLTSKKDILPVREYLKNEFSQNVF